MHDSADVIEKVLGDEVFTFVQVHVDAFEVGGVWRRRVSHRCRHFGLHLSLSLALGVEVGTGWKWKWYLCP